MTITNDVIHAAITEAKSRINRPNMSDANLMLKSCKEMDKRYTDKIMSNLLVAIINTGFTESKSKQIDILKAFRAWSNAINAQQQFETFCEEFNKIFVEDFHATKQVQPSRPDPDDDGLPF